MRIVRYKGNTLKQNQFELLGFTENNAICLCLYPNEGEERKITLMQLKDIVFVNNDEDKKYLEAVNDFVNDKNMYARLLKYQYKCFVQGGEEIGTEYAFVYAPEDATFANVRSRLIIGKHKQDHYEIILDSVEDMTIK